MASFDWRRLWPFSPHPGTAPDLTQPNPPPSPATTEVSPDRGPPDWAALTAASAAWSGRQPGRRGRVLIASNIGGHGPVSVTESLLAAALAVRDADVEIVLCDSALPACLRAEYSDLPDASVLTDRRLPETFCPHCIKNGKRMFEPLGLKIHWLSEWITEDDRAEARRIAAELSAGEIETYVHEGLNLGEQARAGALRYYTTGDLLGEPDGETVLRRYLEAAILSAVAYRRLLSAKPYDVAVFHHGLYVPQGAVGEVCRAMGVKVVNWVVAYRNNSFIFSHQDTYHHTMMTEPVADWDRMRWGRKQAEQIAAYLKSRWYGARDWIGFHERPSEDVAAWMAEAGIDPKKPIIGMLSNVLWDAQLHYPANAFPDLVDWTVRTIEWFRRRPDLQLLLRVHPAEIRGTAPSRQPLVGEIAKRIPQLPANVFIIPPDSDISTYAAMERCDSVLIYGTKMGVELTSVGIPVVVAGEAWIKNKGLTLDAATPEEYFAFLDRLPLRKRLDKRQIDRARRYAFHFFFRRMIPLTFLRREASMRYFNLHIESADDLTPGRSLGLDVICEGILAGKPFIYPAEIVGAHDL